jgi:hypothetical protein
MPIAAPSNACRNRSSLGAAGGAAPLTVAPNGCRIRWKRATLSPAGGSTIVRQAGRLPARRCQITSRPEAAIP